MNALVGLYIHIPFCRQRCDFCAFYLELYREDAATSFLSALKTEIALYAGRNVLGDRTVQSVYFGGGTPTALDPSQLTGIIREVQERFPLSPDCEVTVEAHPRTVSKDYLSALADAGVTRMSFGAESLKDHELRRVGRPGNVFETVHAVICAQEAGLTNLNIDLMYGLPDQSVESWKETLNGCLSLAPSHLSCYALTIENGTRLSRHVCKDLRPAPVEDLQIVMEDAAQTILGENGYERYEISNYARPGFACRHNLLYWTGGEYLGLGPSAQSYVNGTRFGNIADLAGYQRALAGHHFPTEDLVHLTCKEQLRDRVLFGLRLLHGVPTECVQEHGRNYGHSLVLQALRHQRLLEDTATETKLTPQGLRLVDSIAEMLY